MFIRKTSRPIHRYIYSMLVKTIYLPMVFADFGFIGFIAVKTIGYPKFRMFRNLRPGPRFRNAASTRSLDPQLQ
jgi:hypothetical protein